MNLTVNRLLLAIFVSILIHVLGLWLYEQFGYFERGRSSKSEKSENLKIKTLSLDDLQKDKIKKQVIKLDK